MRPSMLIWQRSLACDGRPIADAMTPHPYRVTHPETRMLGTRQPTHNELGFSSSDRRALEIVHSARAVQSPAEWGAVILGALALVAVVPVALVLAMLNALVEACFDAKLPMTLADDPGDRSNVLAE